MKIAVGGVVLILAIGCIVFLMKGMDGAKQPKRGRADDRAGEDGIRGRH